jgi:hypothetical protein
VRIFRIDHSTSLLTELVPFKASPGSGPRHGAFLASGDATYFFLVSELGNTVTSYRVLYGSDSLSFKELSSSGIYGDRKTPEGAAAAAALLTVSISPSINQSSIHKSRALIKENVKISSLTINTSSPPPATQRSSRSHPSNRTRAR